MNVLFCYSRNIVFATEKVAKDSPECPVMVGKKNTSLFVVILPPILCLALSFLFIFGGFYTGRQRQTLLAGLIIVL